MLEECHIGHDAQVINFRVNHLLGTDDWFDAQGLAHLHACRPQRGTTLAVYGEKSLFIFP